MPVVVHIAIIKAAEDGDVERIKELHNKNNSIEIKEGKLGDTPLIRAAKFNREAAVVELLDRKARLEIKNKLEETALIAAAENGHLQVVMVLLRRGADVHAKDLYGATALITASHKGYPEVVEELLQHGGDIKDRNKKGMTALMLAAQNGHLTVVKLLKEKGSDINAVSSLRSATALLEAMRCDHTDVAEYLIENGADTKRKYSDSKQCMVLALRNGQYKFVEYLMDAGQSVYDLNSFGDNAWHICGKYGQMDVAKLLVGRKISVNMQNNRGDTALHLSVFYKHYDLTRYLLSQGSDLNLKTKSGETAEDVAKNRKDTTIMEILSSHIDSGKLVKACVDGDFNVIKEHLTKIDDFTPTGQTLLTLVTSHGHMHIVQKLIAAGASVNQCDSRCNSPLSMAVKCGHIPLVQLFLRENAQVDIMDMDGNTPLHEAVKGNHYNIVQLLVKYGAILLQNSLGETPMDIAIKNGRIDIVNLLPSQRSGLNLSNITDNKVSASAAGTTSGTVRTPGILTDGKKDDQKEDKTASKGVTKVQAPVATHIYTDDQLLYIVNKLSPSVCCLTYPGQVATGFVVGGIQDSSTQQTYRYVITCHHLKIQQAIRLGKHCEAKFDVTSASLGLTVDVTQCVFYEDEDLDYVLIRLEPSSILDTHLRDVVQLGTLIHDVHPKVKDPLVRIGQETFKSSDVGAYAIDETDSLIQQVKQEREQIAGSVKYIGDRSFILYHSSTEGGSSGSPVFSVGQENLYAMHCGLISNTINVGEYAVHLWSVIQDIKRKVENNIGNRLKLNMSELYQLFPQLEPKGMES